jgi:dipeptidase
VVLVLPYIHSAREGALRLGSLIEQYGTYEPNGIAFSDAQEIWWLESIGGHHWSARKVKDEEYVVMPNQFGLDRFDFADAYGAKKENLCSPDLKDFVDKNHLALDQKDLSIRVWPLARTMTAITFITPRGPGSWNATSIPGPYRWEGPNADFTPESDDIPWSLVPEKKITVEEAKYILSSHFQGTPYDPYSKLNAAEKGLYRPIGISRTAFLSIVEIRPDHPKKAPPSNGSLSVPTSSMPSFLSTPIPLSFPPISVAPPRKSRPKVSIGPAG